MVDNLERTDWGIDRRTVLRTMAGASAMGVIGIPTLSGSAVAQTESETLYLTDSGDAVDDDGGTILFEVTLDDDNVVANLEELLNLDDGYDDLYDQVDAIACTPDGAEVYAIDKFSRHIGVYDVSDETFTDIGEIPELPDNAVQAAFSPEGILYISSNETNNLHVIDTTTPAISSTIDLDDGFSMEGADIVFGADGTLYIYTNVGDDTNEDGLYKITDLTVTEPITPTYVGTVASGSFTGLAIRDAGTGNLVASARGTKLYTIDPSTGSQVTAYDTLVEGNSYTVGYGDMTVGALDVCPESELDLCAGQDTYVGTVTVSEFGGSLSITYEMDPEAGWLLYETHVDIGDEMNDLHTNRPGNPKIGNFDLSMEHDGATSYTYTVDCDDPALEDVAADASMLYIATHAVVKPADGCVDFSVLEPGDSVEGFGALSPVLDIQSGYADGEVLMSVEGSDPFYYGSDETVGAGGGDKNGCLDPAGFADIVATDASGQNRPHKYVFTVADGVTLSDFSLRMQDFGDYNPSKNSHHYGEMVAYDADGNPVGSHVLEYWSDGKLNPNTWSWTDPSAGGTLGGNLQDAGDACNAQDGEPGNWLWQVSGDNIVKIELTMGDGHDPNIAFNELCFTATDETAWTCKDQDGVERFVDRGNWATYFTYDLCQLDAGLDCK